MTMPALFLTLLSVAMICAGQLMFKWIGTELQAGAAFTQPSVLIAGIASIALYGIATVIWILVLRTTPLTVAYPFMALSFVVVPIGGVLLFSERISVGYAVGLALIVAGVLATAYFRR